MRLTHRKACTGCVTHNIKTRLGLTEGKRAVAGKSKNSKGEKRRKPRPFTQIYELSMELCEMAQMQTRQTYGTKK